MANSTDNRHDAVAPKGGHASANPETVVPAGQAQRQANDLDDSVEDGTQPGSDSPPPRDR